MEKLSIAIQKQGRLSQDSIGLLVNCGINVKNGSTKLRTEATNFPLEVFFLRDDDIPEYVGEGVVEAGILGLNVVDEKERPIDIVRELGFAHCRLALAVKRGVDYPGLHWLSGKKVATSYPNILHTFLNEHGISADIEVISGSVEIAPGIGLADAVCDIVSTGSTLLANGLEEVQTVMRSEAVLVKNRELGKAKSHILEQLLFRINAVKHAERNKYILLNAPNDAIETISNIIPGMKRPSVLPLLEPGWSSMHSVVKEDQFWQVVDQLKAAGAEGILVCPIEKMVL